MTKKTKVGEFAPSTLSISTPLSVNKSVTATGLAYDQATRDWTQPVSIEARNRQEAINWVRFQRDWLKDLRIDGVRV